MKKQDIQAEIAFFQKAAREGRVNTVSEEVYHQILAKIKPYLGHRVLEAGCGAGTFGERIKRKKPQITLIGVDLTKKMIDLAKEKGIYQKLYCQNIEDKTTFKKLSFDAIICPYLLHHLPEAQRSINNFHRWLKPGGYLIIIDPNGSNFILKISYLMRIIGAQFIDYNNNFASINEKNKTVPEFKRHLYRYKIIKIITFQHKNPQNQKINFPFAIKVLGWIRKKIVKLYAYLPFIKWKGSDLIIVAQK